MAKDLGKFFTGLALGAALGLGGGVALTGTKPAEPAPQTQSAPLEGNTSLTVAEALTQEAATVRAGIHVYYKALGAKAPSVSWQHEALNAARRSFITHVANESFHSMGAEKRFAEAALVLPNRTTAAVIVDLPQSANEKIAEKVRQDVTAEMARSSSHPVEITHVSLGMQAVMGATWLQQYVDAQTTMSAHKKPGLGN